MVRVIAMVAMMSAHVYLGSPYMYLCIQVMHASVYKNIRQTGIDLLPHLLTLRGTNLAAFGVQGAIDDYLRQ